MFHGCVRMLAAVAAVVAMAAFAHAKDGQVRVEGTGGSDSLGSGCEVRITAKQGDKTYDVTISYPHDGKTTGADAAKEHGQKIKDAGFVNVTVTGSSIFIIGCEKVDGGVKGGSGKVHFGGTCDHQTVLPGQKFKFTAMLGPGTAGGAWVSIAAHGKDLDLIPSPTAASEIEVTVLAGDTTEMFVDRCQAAMETAGWTVVRENPTTIRLDAIGAGCEVVGVLMTSTDAGSEREAHVQIQFPGAE